MPPQPPPTPAGITFNDILFILFRHPWKIGISILMTLLVAGGFLLIKAPPYASTSKLLLRYVVENKDVEPGSADAQIKSPDARGESIISSEIEIFRSLDLARQVATNVGPAKILAKLGGGDNPGRAAGVIASGLTAEAPKRGSVITVIFRHPDPEVVQPVLAELVQVYFKRHAEIHRSSGVFDDFISQQAESLRARLVQTESELRQLKQQAGVIDLVGTKQSYAAEITTLRQNLFAAESELAQKKASLAELEKLSPAKIASEASELGIPAEKISEYKRLGARLEQLRKMEEERSLEMTPDHPVLKQLVAQINEAQSTKETLEKEFPKLSTLSIPAAGSADKSIDRASELMLVRSLEARIQSITNQIAKVKEDVAAIDSVESRIHQLDLKRQLEETNYRAYASSLEQSRIESAIGANNISNISVVQAPTPPARDASTLKKPLLMIFALGLAITFGLPFLIEMVLDKSIKRPIEMETRLRAPHMLSIPYLNGKVSGQSKLGRLFSFLSRRKADSDEFENDAASSDANLQVAPWDPRHKLRFFFEAIRDNLIHHFEVNQLQHKPKLVAVTGCGKGSGVSTLAAGLAASLSETGDGNVLLVDMNPEQGAAHPFYKGKPDCGLVDALEVENRDNAMIQSNLYMVRADNPRDKLQRALPLRFSSLIPKLKASDYDYIIFDMPAVSQTSITQKLASYMDSVLLVVESEKTHVNRAKRISDQLLQSQAKVTTVLNKTRQYGPDWLNES